MPAGGKGGLDSHIRNHSLLNTAKIKILAMKIISDRNKLPIAQSSDIDRAAPEGKGAKWAQTNLHQNPDLPRHSDPAEGPFSVKEALQRAGIPRWQKRYLDPPVHLLLPQVLLKCHWSRQDIGIISIL